MEVRGFIKNGIVEELYPYYHWSGLVENVSGDILNEVRRDYEKNFIEVIRRDLPIILKYSKLIAERMDGYWSVDFARTEKDWYFIDMALGESSWRPEELDDADKKIQEALREVG